MPQSLSLASLSYTRSGVGGLVPPSRQVVLKRSKLEVEEDEGTGLTPNLQIAQCLLHAATAGNDQRSNRKKGGGQGGEGASSWMEQHMATSYTATVDQSPSVVIRTDLHDVHLYVISNWVFDLI